MTGHRVAVGIVVVFASVGFAQITPVINTGGVVRGADNYDAYVNGVARGSLFGIYGTNLAPSAASATDLPVPMLLNGVRVKISSNAAPGPEWAVPLLYVSPFQINAILPSAVTEGYQSVIVEVNGVASAPAPIIVATRQFAAFASGQFGFGPALLQQVDSSGASSVNSFRNPAASGQAVVLWGTGLGPLPAGADDAAAPGMVDLSADVTVYVGTVAVKPFYAGRAPTLPGVDQINFYLPDTVLSRCFVPLTVAVGPVSSGPLTFSAGTPGAMCTSELGLSSDLLERLDQGGTVRVAALSIDTESSFEISGQPVEAWLGDYDAAGMSLLVSGWQSPPVQPVAHCEKSSSSHNPNSSPQDVNIVSPIQAHLHGQIVGGVSAPWVQLTGSGCSLSLVRDGGIWQSENSNCTASSYALFTFASGEPAEVLSATLPPLRPAVFGDWLGFWPQPDQSTQVRWFGGQPDDQLILNLGSGYSLEPFPIPSTTISSSHSLVCTLPPGSSSFDISPDAYSFALSSPNQTAFVKSATPSLQTVPNPVTIPGDPPGPATFQPDLVLVLIRNGLADYNYVLGP
jgi:uncharacterized protein (TIGR03437 family)